MPITITIENIFFQLKNHSSSMDFSSNLQTSEDIRVFSKFIEVFKDEHFKPNVASLINFDDNKLSNEDKTFWSTLEWKRLSQISPFPLHLLENASFRDPIQGYIGNCYLLSVCSAIAEYPNRLKQIFIITEINRAGMYAIQLYIDGTNTKIVIDDFIPVQCNSKSPVFAKLPESKNIWPIIIEKAWAKILKNYQNTISGSPTTLFNVLTGAPSESFNTSEIVKKNDIECFWKKLKDFYYNNYFICASTSSATLEIEAIGLVANHAYTVLFFEEFEHKEGRRKVVKLRNPWGKINLEKFEADFLTKSYLKNEEVKQNIGDQKEGAFVLTFEEFLNFFSTLHVCKYMDNYKTHSYRLKTNPMRNEHFHCIHIDLRHAKNPKNKIYLTVNKPTFLDFCRGDQEKNSIYSFILLGKLNANNDVKFLRFESGYSSNTIELETFEKSEYVALIHIDKFEGKSIDLKNNLGYLSVYSFEDEIVFTEQFNSNALFSRLIYDYYQKFGDSFQDKLNIISEDGLATMNSFRLPGSSYNFVLFENLSDNILWYGMESVKIVDYSNCPNQGSIIIPQAKDFYEGDLEFSKYFLLCCFNASGVAYKYRTKIKLSKENLKNEVRNKGKYHGIQYRNSNILIKSFFHENGAVIYVRNNYENMVNLILKMNIANLFCAENPENEINLFPEFEKEYFFFFEIIDSNERFVINWNSRIVDL